MAYAKSAPRKSGAAKGGGKSGAFSKFKSDLSAGTLSRAYIFYGEEAYLREHYLKQLRETLIDETFSAFNYHRTEGKDLSAQTLREMIEAMPMMAERTLIVVIDYDLFRLPEDQRNQLIALLDDLPEWCCLVFVYDTIAYQPNRTMKKLCKAIADYVQEVEFRPLDHGDLLAWIARKFRELDKNIDRNTADYLVFTCGEFMTGLSQEIQKIAAYTEGPVVTKREIDAAAEPVLSTEVFRLSDAVLKGDFDGAARRLGELLKLDTEPILILATLGSQIRRIYTARLILDNGREDRARLMDLWGMRSDYPAKLLFAAARQTSTQWCVEAVRACQELDRRMKSEGGLDAAGELKTLLVTLEAGR